MKGGLKTWNCTFIACLGIAPAVAWSRQPCMDGEPSYKPESPWARAHIQIWADSWVSFTSSCLTWILRDCKAWTHTGMKCTLPSMATFSLCGPMPKMIIIAATTTASFRMMLVFPFLIISSHLFLYAPPAKGWQARAPNDFQPHY